jgi:integrase
MALGKQAKIVDPRHVAKLLDHVAKSRHPDDRVMVLLSFKAGLRAKEIAGLSWAMVTDARGELADVISLQNRASKAKRGGRIIQMHPELAQALAAGGGDGSLPPRIVGDLFDPG